MNYRWLYLNLANRFEITTGAATLWCDTVVVPTLWESMKGFAVRHTVGVNI